MEPPGTQRTAVGERRAPPCSLASWHASILAHRRCPACPAGGKLVYQLAKKKTTHPTCPISGQRLHGVSPRGSCSSRQLQWEAGDYLERQEVPVAACDGGSRGARLHMRCRRHAARHRHSAGRWRQQLVQLLCRGAIEPSSRAAAVKGGISPICMRPLRSHCPPCPAALPRSCPRCAPATCTASARARRRCTARTAATWRRAWSRTASCAPSWWRSRRL